MPQRESSTLQVKSIWYTAFGLLLLVSLVGCILLFYQKTLVKGFQGELKTPEQSPREQVEFESGELVQKLREKQVEALESYHLENIQSGWVQVPIGRALDFLVDKKSLKAQDLFGPVRRSK